MLVSAIVTITLALVFYSIGVWSEKLQKSLKPWHVIVFWMGFIFDTTGTTLMSKMAESDTILTVHGMTGLIAIVLMLFHAIWATVVLVKNNEHAKANFHKFSIVVWIIWLIPYLSGMIVGMSQ